MMRIMKIFSEELVAQAVRNLHIADLSRATIGEVLLVAQYLEKETGIPFVRMDQGSPGLPANQYGIEAEKARATRREDLLQEQISEIDVTDINEKIAKNTTKLHAITEWDGTDPAEYEDGGNGILDVLHREFHEYEKTHGSIKSIEYIDGNPKNCAADNLKLKV